MRVQEEVEVIKARSPRVIVESQPPWKPLPLPEDEERARNKRLLFWLLLAMLCLCAAVLWIRREP